MANILNFMYVLCGVVLIIAGIYSLMDKKNPKRIGTFIFWILFGVIFIGGTHLKSNVVGAILLFMGVLTATKNVSIGSLTNSSEEYRKERAMKIGNKIFIPAISIGILAFVITQILKPYTNLNGLLGLSFAAILSLVITLIITKENPKYITYDSTRVLQQMGVTVILPQLLVSLGSIFKVAGVGEIISEMVSKLIPEGNILAGVIVYCLGMALFTMIMGNAFAAFSVIVLGIGIPFLINEGGNPVIIGALGLTAGYCGTLITPMAANFNIIPATILEMKNKNGVMLTQLPLAILLLIAHIVLIYILAF